MKIQGFERMPERMFHRLTGVRKWTFLGLVAVLKQTEVERTAQCRKPNCLAVEMRLLLMLKYW